MDTLEKILFINLTCKQLSIPNSDHPEYFKTWEILSRGEKEAYVKLTNEIHEIWTYINMPRNIDLGINYVSSVFEYHENVAPVSSKILTTCKDFEISLRRELTEEFKKAVKKILGNDYLNWLEE